MNNQKFTGLLSTLLLSPFSPQQEGKLLIFLIFLRKSIMLKISLRTLEQTHAAPVHPRHSPAHSLSHPVEILFQFLYITTASHRHTPPNRSTRTLSSHHAHRPGNAVTMPWIGEIPKKSPAMVSWLNEKGLVQSAAAPSRRRGRLCPALRRVSCMSNHGRGSWIGRLPCSAAAEVSARRALVACLLFQSASFFSP